MMRAAMAPRAQVLAAAACGGVAIALAISFYVGFRSYEDDVMTAFGALRWLTDPPHLGLTHWELRLPQVWSVSASYALLGVGAWQTSVPGIAAFAVLCVSAYALAARHWSASRALLPALLVSCSTVNVLTASIITPDMMEVMFVLLSLLMFMMARSQSCAADNLRRYLLLAGVFAGLAFLTRVTAGALIVFYALTLLLRPVVRRSAYQALFLAFALVVLADWSLCTMLSGDPLHRLKAVTNQNHPTGPFSVFSDPRELPVRVAESVRLKRFKAGGQRVAPGVISGDSWLYPWLSLLVNHEFGPLFWSLAISVPYLFFCGRLQPGQAALLLLLAALGAIWMLILVYGLKLRPHPRYFLVTALAPAFAYGAMLANLIDRRRLVFAGALAGLFAVASLIAASLDRTALVAEQRLIALLGEFPQAVVHVDAETYAAARFFAESRGLGHRLSTAAPAVGDFYFWKAQRPDDLPAENWEIVRPVTRNPTVLAPLLALPALQGLLPPAIAEALAYRHPGSALLRRQ